MATTVIITVTFYEDCEDKYALCDALATAILPDYTCSADVVVATCGDETRRIERTDLIPGSVQ